MRRFSWAGPLAIAATAAAAGIYMLLAVAGPHAGAGNAQDRAPSGITAVERVVDGDTIDVSCGGTSYRVRLKGVDCPESVHPDESRNTPGGKTASDFTKGLLPPGSSVWLEADPSGDDTDSHGRSLRYVWLSDPAALDRDDPATVASEMLEGLLLSSGNAEVYAYRNENFRYRTIFEEIAS